jgi:flavin reductase (DIM6/NTAB) family NADH-FMN oxidoreductase RutF
MDLSTVSAFLRIPYGIYLLGTSQIFPPQTMVVSWVSQVSFSPPLLMVALRHNRPAIAAILEEGFFSLNLLKAEQLSLVSRIKGTLSPLEANTLFTETQMESAKFYRLKDCLAFWGCKAVSKSEPGDHILFIAEVLLASATVGKPLVTSECGKTYIGEI